MSDNENVNKNQSNQNNSNTNNSTNVQGSFQNQNQNISNQSSGPQPTQPKKKKNIGTKLIITGIVGGTVLYNGVKSFIFGSPPKPWRKALFYGSLLTLFAYNSCSDQIDGAFGSAQKKADEWWNNSNYESKVMLESEVEKLKAEKNKVYDSLSTLLVKKDYLISNKNNRIGQLEEKVLTRVEDANNKAYSANEEARKLKFEVKETKKKLEKYIHKKKSSTKSTKPTYEFSKPVNRQVEKPFNKTYAEGVLWYVVQKGDMLGDVSKKLTGDLYKFKEIADFNGLDNPNDVPIGFPLEIPSQLVKEYSGLRTDDMPTKFSVLNKGETVVHLVQRLYGKNDQNKVNEILQYNKHKGNEIPVQGFGDVNKAVVYIK